MVSGLAALMKSYRPVLINDEIEEILKDTADDLGPAGWDDHFGFGRINAAAAMAVIPAPLQIVSSDPPHLAIDARQPFDIDGTHPDGWRNIRLTFNGYALNLTAGDFTIMQEGGAGQPPSVAAVLPVTEDTVTLVLNARIAIGAWTTITHISSGTTVRLGYLPGDVNADLFSSPLDVLALIDALNGVGALPPIWSVDVNRSDTMEPSDILREIDLLNGAGVYDMYNGWSLP
jgi:hypothetical protein